MPGLPHPADPATRPDPASTENFASPVQAHCYQALLDRLDLPRDVAYDPKWSAAPDFLATLVDHVLATAPTLIVECSSGATTVMLARCCAMNGVGEVWSLENGPEFATRTRAELTRLGLSSRATVIDAPLVEYLIEGRFFRWYNLDQLPGRAIDMLAIDGPPGFLQRHSRLPALPLLHDRLAGDCAIFLDDAARPDERDIVAAWQRAYPEFDCRFLDHERGCAILDRRSAGAG